LSRSKSREKRFRMKRKEKGNLSKAVEKIRSWEELAEEEQRKLMKGIKAKKQRMSTFGVGNKQPNGLWSTLSRAKPALAV
jgi:hypothetical protein